MALHKECLNQVLGRLDPVKFLAMYPHSSAPCHNLQFYNSVEKIDNIEHFSNLFTAVNYQVSCPVPVSFPSVIDRAVANGIDPALQSVKSKKNWEDCKHRILKFCNEKDSEIITGTSSKATVEIPQNVVLLANHLKKDPDIHFNANYNSYFNGTNIACLDFGLEKFLIRPETYGNGNIVVSRLNLNENPWDIDFCNNVSSTGIPGPIFEINTNKNIIVTRQKQNISLFSWEDEENEVSVSKKLSLENNCPFVSICTDGSNFCTLTAEREFQLFDLAVGRQVFNEKFYNDSPMSDNWGSVFHVNDNTISYLDRSSCGVIDLRIKNEVKKWHMKDFTEHCEEVYSGGIGLNELQYVTTSHQVLSLDLRMGFSQRWTHCIGHSPAVMSVHSTSTSSDMLFIGSQRNDTVVLIENDRNGNKSSSKIEPYALPSLRETLHLAQYNGYCLGNTVQSRFKMSLTGLCCVESRDGITLFSSTSVGDVFKQTLKKCSEVSKFELDENELNKLENWEEQCEDLLLESNSPCYVTDILDDNNILQCIQDNKNLYEEPSKSVEKGRGKWNISKKELMSYCDYLAPRILEEWGIDVEEEWCKFTEQTFDELSSDDEDNVGDRVIKWIEKYRGEMATNAVVNENESRGESIVVQNNIVNPNPVVFEELEKNVKPDVSSAEPSSLKDMTPVAKPKKKFISGF